MKRSLILLLLIFLFPWSLATNAVSDAVSAAEDMYSALDENGQEAAKEAQNGKGFDLNAGLSKVLKITANSFTPILTASLKTACKLLITALVFSLAELTFGNGKDLTAGLNLAATGVIAAVGIAEINSGLQLAIEHQNRLSDFIGLLLPVLTAAGAAGGSGGESRLCF